MKPFVANHDTIDLQRRGLLKGALCGAIASVLSPRLLWAAPPSSLTPDRCLYLKGEILEVDSSIGMTKLWAGKLPGAKFIEFATRATAYGENPPPTAAHSHIDAWLPLDSNLYTDEDPPLTADPSTANQTPIPWVGPKGRPGVTGLVMDDGSPATLMSASAGCTTGIKGSRKGGSGLSICIHVGRTTFNHGQTSQNTPAWITAKATVSAGARDPVLTLALGYELATYSAVLAIFYKNVQSTVAVDMHETIVANSIATLTRDVSYHGQSVSNEKHQCGATAAPFGIVLATPPVWPVIDRVSAFAPALFEVVQHVPSSAPLLGLGSLDVNQGESRPAFVTRTTNSLTTALPSLPSYLCDGLQRGWADLARWLGWSMISEKATLESVLADTWDYWTALAKLDNGSVDKPTPLPTMRSSDPDGVANQISDWAEEHKN